MQLSLEIRTDYSHHRALGVDLRRDKLGKIDFRQILEGIRRVQTRDDRVVAEFKYLYCKRSMTNTVNAGIAPIIIFMLFKGRRGALVVCGFMKER